MMALGLDLRRFSDSSPSESPRSMHSSRSSSSGEKLGWCPWDSTLMPTEPDPDDYLTYDEFESAYKRWASLVSKASFIPPHTTQLRQIIPIIPPLSKDTSVVEDVYSLSTPDEITHRKMGLKHFEFLEYTKIPRELWFQPHRPWHWRDLEVEHEDILVDREVVATLSNQIDSLILKLSPFQSFRNGEKPLYIVQKKLKVDNFYGNISNFRNDVLAQPNSPVDCAKVPFYDISNLSYSRTLTDKSYVLMIKKKLNQLKYIYSSKILVLESPKEDDTASTINMDDKKYKDELVALITSAQGDKTKLGSVLHSLLHILISDKVLKDVLSLQSKPLIHLFDEKNISTLLEYFESSNNPSVHLRVSYIVSQLFQEPEFMLALENLILKEDLNSLSRLTYALMMCKQVPLSVFPYKLEHIKACTFILGRQYHCIVMTIYILYYMSILMDQCNTNELYSLNQDPVKTKHTEIYDSLKQLLKENPTFLLQDIYKGLTHRSKEVAYVSLFLWNQLYNDTQLVKTTVGNDFPVIFSNLRRMASSKFSHVRLMLRHIYSKLKSRPWVEHVLEWQTVILEDLMTPSVNVDYYEFLLDLVAIDIDDASIRTDNTHTKWILNNDVVHKIIRSMNSEDTGLIIYRARLLQCVFKGCYKLGLLKQTQGTATIIISPDNIQNIMNLMNKNPSTDHDTYNALLLSCLRYMLISNQSYEYLKREESIHIFMSKFCKSHHQETCKESWKFMYQMIVYHPGITESLTKRRFISCYFDHISVSGGNHAMRYSLHYLGKLFSLPPQDQKRGLQTKWKVNLDLKALSNFFIQSHLFIKIHMMYKNLIDGRSGAAFYELSNLYNLIATSPNCKKLYKEISKSDDFREGIRRVCLLSSTMPVDLKTSKGTQKVFHSRKKGTLS